MGKCTIIRRAAPVGGLVFVDQLEAAASPFAQQFRYPRVGPKRIAAGSGTSRPGPSAPRAPRTCGTCGRALDDPPDAYWLDFNLAPTNNGRGFFLSAIQTRQSCLPIAGLKYTEDRQKSNPKKSPLVGAAIVKEKQTSPLFPTSHPRPCPSSGPPIPIQDISGCHAAPR
jgi:hypothetical protein